jgi:Gpi18-like mannosyltransferase
VRSGIGEGSGDMEGARRHFGSRVLWWVIWGGMALLASVNALAPYGILSDWRGIELGAVLGVAATIQLLLDCSFLSHRNKVLATVVLVLFGGGLFGQRIRPSGSGADFGAYYVVGHIAAQQPPGRLYYEATSTDGRFDLWKAGPGWQETASRFGVSQAFVFIYPPIFAVLMEPFNHFSYRAAYSLWNAITIFLTFASIWLIFRIERKRIDNKVIVILLVGLFSFSPFYEELLYGQVASLIFFLCTLGIWLLSRSREWESAFCFALATMIKITPIAVVPLLAIHRKWKWLAAYVFWMTFLIGFSVWRAGWVAHEQFLHEVMPSLSCGVTNVGNLSIMAFVQELFIGFVPKGEFQARLPPVLCMASKAMAVTIFGVLMVRFYLYRREENLVLHLSLVILLSLVISPIVWIHHYVVALFPMNYLWCRTTKSRTDYLLFATVLAVGTNFTFVAILISRNHRLVELALAGIVPLLTLALVWFRASGKGLVEDGFESAYSN